MSNDLQQRIGDLVSRVIHETTGRVLRPGPDEPLIRSGILDSLAMVNLIVMLQQEFAVELDVPDLHEDNFASVAAIARLVAARR